jgi:hypothetical protein
MNAMIPLPKRSGEPLREMDLCAWVTLASPGETLEYHRGFLGIDRTSYGLPMTAEARTDLLRTCDRALKLAEQDLVHLVQRRLGPESFSYVAIARKRRAPKPLSFDDIFTGETV